MASLRREKLGKSLNHDSRRVGLRRAGVSRQEPGHAARKNAIFVFRVDDIRIAHLGDLGHLLTPQQLQMLGKIDILLVPIAGGYYTVTASEAREVTKQVKPKIAIPMHFWWEQAVQEYIQGTPRVRMLNSPALKISKPELPQPTDVVVMPWAQR
jgi:L-ascorbate metabolism protein UlaG (beta-lactamase superfamily)